MKRSLNFAVLVLALTAGAVVHGGYERNDTLHGKEYQNPHIVLDDFDTHKTLDFGDGDERRVVHAIEDNDGRQRVLVLKPQGQAWRVTADMRLQAVPDGLIFIGTVPENPDLEFPPVACSANGKPLPAFGFRKESSDDFQQNTDQELVWTLDEQASAVALRNVDVHCRFH